MSDPLDPAYPTDPRERRRAELIAGALSDDLDESERAEFARLRATDPTVDDELAQLGGIAAEVAASGWDASAPSAALRYRVLGIGSEAPDNPVVSLPRRRPWLAVAAAAACVAIGAGGVLTTQALTDRTPTGAPGALGVVEPIEFTGQTSGVAIDAALVAHTWGTETQLTIDGLPAAETFDVVLVTTDGDVLSSGSFLGSTVEIECEMNAAVLRESVAGVQIQDDAGHVVAKAAVPLVG